MLAEEPRAARRRAKTRPQIRRVRPARGRRAAARQAEFGARVHAARADGAEMRYGLDSFLCAVHEEGLAPEARRGPRPTESWTGSCTTRSGPTRARPT